MQFPDSGSGEVVWRVLAVDVPSCPWKVTATVQYSAPNTNNVVVNGIYLSDGTKLIGFESELTSSGFIERVEHITNVTTDGPNVYASNTGFSLRNDYQGTWAVQIRDDCTNYYFDSSVNGVVWYNLYSEAVGTWLTATRAGFGASQSQGATAPGFFTLNTWQVYGDANLDGP